MAISNSPRDPPRPFIDCLLTTKRNIFAQLQILCYERVLGLLFYHTTFPQVPASSNSESELQVQVSHIQARQHPDSPGGTY